MNDSRPLTVEDLSSRPVTDLKGVGARRAKAFSELGLESLWDVLTYYPRRYIDRTREVKIAELAEGSEAMVLGTVTRASTRRTRNRRTIVELEVKDASGSLRVTFFNQPWRARQLAEGTEAVFFGRPERYRGRTQLTNPVVDVVGGDQTGRIVPVYPQSEKAGVSSIELSRAVGETLRRSRPRGIADPLPEQLREKLALPGRYEAFEAIHFPETVQQRGRARDRLAFDELFRIQVQLVHRKRQVERASQGLAHRVEGPLIERFANQLQFELTGAQRRAIDQISSDLGSPVPMHRLLQGDVGSGKTLVALWGLLTVVQSGHQGALLAPTEVLAEQHAAGLRALLGDLEVPDETRLGGARPLEVSLLTGRLGAGDRRTVTRRLAAGEVDIVVGTHAILSEGVEFASLGLAVIDEQHRFGVRQRALLRESARSDEAQPDVLVMTATPIPRTAAMTVYGDLDVSVIDELPPGRQPIATERAVGPVEEAAVWEVVRDHIGDGRQAYVVCPLVEGSEHLDVRSAEQTYAELSESELAGLSVGLIHGRMGSAEKELTMEMFRSGKLQVLVATTVIEVGVDVPNATAMVVLDAHRFGIAQLHQLRGRVGRGAHGSVCFLLGQPDTEDGESRVDALVSSTDGFELAEIDLELRGEGTILDDRQSGASDLRLASLRRDKQMVLTARSEAELLLDDDPDLAGHHDLLEELRVLFGDAEGEAAAEYLFRD